MGRAEEPVDNSTGSAGDVTVKWRRGRFHCGNDGSDAVTAADIGTVCDIVDDQTVAATDGTGSRSKAGIVEEVSSAGVWVRFDEALTRVAQAMSDLFPVQCDREIDGAPEWVQLLPMGQTLARDGRFFANTDQDAIIADFRSRVVDLPIDYEHQNDKPLPKLLGPVPVAGWLKELATRADGLWGRVEWTARARELIANREYRYLSPSLMVEKTTRKIGRLKGAGLVHNPALHIAALASQEDTMADTPEFMMRLAQMLNLPEDSEEAAILEALGARLADNKPDPRKYVPAEAVQEVMREMTQERSSARQERVTAKVEDAMRRGYLIPAMRTWATELCQADEASFDQFIGCGVPAFAHLTQKIVTGIPPGPDAPGTASAETALLSAQLGIDPKSLM